MDVGMEENFMREPFVADEFEIDFDYEFDAPQYSDFYQPETVAEAIEAESWFNYAASYPPSPFIEKLEWRHDIGSISCNSRGEFGSDSNDSDIELDFEASAFDASNRGPQLCNGMDQDVSKSKTKFLVKPSLSRCSTLMKPTASYLAKHNQLQDVHFNQFLRSQKSLVKLDKCSQNSSTTENLATKRQKLDTGYFCKNSFLKHQVLFLHKIPKKVGLLDVNSEHARCKVTIPREPNLETAHRAQRHRAKINAETVEHAKPNTCTFKARPLNRKILETPSLHSPRKSTLQLPEFQVFQLRTSERARKHACNSVSTTRNYNSLARKETKDSRRVHFVDALKEDKYDVVQKIKANPPIKKIYSSRGELGVFRHIKQETIVPMIHNFPVDNRLLNEPPVELFSKLSLASEVHSNFNPQPKMLPLVTKGSKENAPRSCLLEQEINVVKEKSPSCGRNQYQCGSESNDRKITEGGSRFNINRNLNIR